MKTNLASIEANKKSIHNLEIQLEKLAKEIAKIREENSKEVNAHT